MKLTKTFWTISLSFLIFLLTTKNNLNAQVNKGDFITVTLKGSNTYDIESFKCFRHGKYDGSFSYYQQAKGGWTSAESNKINYAKFDMPKIGEEIYVLKSVPDYKTGKWASRPVKGILKQVGIGGWDTYGLAIKAEITDGAGNPSIEDFNHYASKTEVALLGWPTGDAAKPTIPDADLRKLEAEIMATINEARSNPTAFASKIAAYGTSDPVVQETVTFLQSIPNLNHTFSPLTRMSGLDKAAREHAADHAKDTNVGHKGSSADCSVKTDYVGCRLKRHGIIGNTDMTGENIYSGGGASVYAGSGAVMALILDHGIASRGHRAAFFDTFGNNLTADKKGIASYMCNYTAAGIGCAYDKKSGNISCVMNFADTYQNK